MFSSRSDGRNPSLLIAVKIRPMSTELLNRITSNPRQCGGRPCISRMRIRVKDVLHVLAGGASEEEILTDFPYLEPEDSSVSRIRRRPDRSRGGHGLVVNFLVDAQLPPGLGRWLTRDTQPNTSMTSVWPVPKTID